MKSLIYIIISAFFAGAALIGCGGSRYGEARLKAADAVMTAAPDSALRILTEINPDSLSERQRAWYYLLLTKANDKNYKPIDKSMIAHAVAYYEGKGDSLEAQSLYYLGCYYSVNYVLDTALVVLNLAYETALDANDIFYAAMSAREMADVYRHQYILDEELKWGLIAKDHFSAADRPMHAAWMSHTITDALLYNGHYDSANALLDSAAQCVYYGTPPFRYNVLLNRIKLARQVDDYKSMLSLYDSLSMDGFTFKAYDRLNQAQASFAEELYDDAERYLKMARDLNMTETDSLYLEKMLSKLYAANKDYQKAYESAMRYADDLMNSDIRLLSEPQTLLLTDNYRLRDVNHRLQIQRNRVGLVALILVCLLLGIIIVLMRKNYKRDLARERTEIDRLISDSDTLREDLTMSGKRYRELSERHQEIKDTLDRQTSELKTLRRDLTAGSEQYDKLSAQHQELRESLAMRESDLKAMRNNLTVSDDRYRELAEESRAMKSSLDMKESELNALRENLTLSNDRYKELAERHQEIKGTMDRQKSEFAIEVRNLFGRHLDMLNKVSDIWYHTSDKTAGGNSMYKEIHSLLSEMSKIEVIEELTEIINKHDNGWLTKFRQAYPELSDTEYRLAIYLYLGFRPTTIVVLLGYGNMQHLYSAKHRLKKKLLEGSRGSDDPMLEKLF